MLFVHSKQSTTEITEREETFYYSWSCCLYWYLSILRCIRGYITGLCYIMHLFTGEPLDNGWRAWWRTNPTIWFEFDYNYFMLTSISDYFAAVYPPSHSHINPKYFQLCGLFYDNCNMTFKASVKEIQIPKFISAICCNFHDGLFFV